MAPKNKKKAAPKCAPAEPAASDANALCAPQLIRVREALKLIREHPIFEGIDD